MRFLFVLLACSSALAQPVMPFSPSSGGGGGGAESDPLACKVAGLADCQMLAQIRGNAGTASLPSFASPLANAANDGLYFPAAATLGLGTDGTLRLTLGNTSLTSTVQWAGIAGTAATPSLSFSGDPNTGMYSAAADSIGLTAGGTVRLTLTTTSALFAVPVVFPVGTAAAPALTFTGDTDNGWYWIAANRIGATTGGVARLEISAIGDLLPAATTDTENIGVAATAWKSVFLGTSVEGVSNSKALQVVDVDGVQLTANKAQVTLQAGGNIVAQQETVGANGAPVLRLPAFANVAATSVGANLGCSSAAPGAVVVVDDSSSTSTKICVCARVAGVYAYRAIDNLANTCTGM